MAGGKEMEIAGAENPKLPSNTKGLSSRTFRAFTKGAVSDM